MGWRPTVDWPRRTIGFLIVLVLLSLAVFAASLVGMAGGGKAMMVATTSRKVPFGVIAGPEILTEEGSQCTPKQRTSSAAP
jgi:hypothetical protein